MKVDKYGRKGITFDELVDFTEKDHKYCNKMGLKTHEEIELFVADCLETLENAGWIGSSYAVEDKK